MPKNYSEYSDDEVLYNDLRAKAYGPRREIGAREWSHITQGPTGSLSDYKDGFLKGFAEGTALKGFTQKRFGFIDGYIEGVASLIEMRLFQERDGENIFDKISKGAWRGKVEKVVSDMIREERLRFIRGAWPRIKREITIGRSRGIVEKNKSFTHLPYAVHKDRLSADGKCGDNWDD